MFEFFEKQRNEKIIKNVVEKIRSNIDFNELKQSIVNEAGKALKANRCLIITLDIKENKFVPVDEYSVYLSSPSIKTIVGFVPETEGLEFFTDNLKNIKKIVTYISSSVIKENKLEGTKVEEFFNYYDIKTALCAPITYSNQMLGLLIVHYNVERERLTKENVDLIEAITNQISDVFYHSMLFQEKNEILKRETLLRKTIEILRSTFDIEKIKYSFIEIIENYFHPDRCIIEDYVIDTDVILPFRIEYIKSQEMKELKGVNVEENFPEFACKVRKGRSIILKDLEKTLSRKKFSGYKSLETLQEYGVKSDYGIPIVYKGQFYGTLIMHYIAQKRVLTHDELDFLKILVNQAGAAFYQAELFEKQKQTAEREALIKNIVSKMRSSLEIEDVLNYICRELINIFKVQRVSIVTAKEQEDKVELTLLKEIKTSPDIVGFYELTARLGDKAFWGKKTKSGIYALDNINESDLPDDIKNFYLSSGIKSIIGVPIKKGENVFGALVLSEYNEYRVWKGSEKKLLESIADQVYIAINQAELYEKQKNVAEREILLRKIFEAMSSSLDKNVVKQTIVNEVGKAMDIDVCFIVEYKSESNTYDVDEFSEYKSSAEIKSFIGLDPQKGNAQYFLKSFHDKKEIKYANLDDFIETNNLQGTDEERLLKLRNIKSGYTFLIEHGNVLLGYLVIFYTKEHRTLSPEDVDFFKTIKIQAGTSIYQARLYEKIQIQVLREKLISDITLQAIKTFDLSQIKNIVDTIGKMTKADRVFFAELEPEARKVRPIYYEGEYLSSPEIKSISGHEFSVEEGKKFIQIYLEKKDVVVFDYEELLQHEAEEEYKDMVQYIKKFDLKSSVGIPIFFEGSFVAILAIEYVKEKMIPTEDELGFFRILSRHIGMMANQIQLYKDTKKKAERESLLRNIIETIRSSLDIEKTLDYICEETAKLFQVERSAITVFPNLQNFDDYMIRKEYKKSDKIKSFDEVAFGTKIAAYWGEILLRTNNVTAYDNVLESDAPDYFKTSYNNLGIRSMMGTAIRKGDNIWGTLVLSEYEDYRHWSEDEKTLLKSIADQVYIAINQAELYEKEKLAAERERISRNIVEILRSTMDKNIIKRLFVKNIGKFFNADRVLISEYSPEVQIYLPADENSEYLSNPNEKTLVGYNWSNREVRELTKTLLEKRELNIYNANEYFEKNEKDQDFINFFKNYNIKSSYNFPILYQQNIIGFFCLDFMKEVKRLSEEDINKLRSICTQAGIALYHAELYTKAQQWLTSKDTVLSEISHKIQLPTNEILETSILLTENEFERKVQIDYLNSIINSCDELIKLTSEISEK